MLNKLSFVALALFANGFALAQDSENTISQSAETTRYISDNLYIYMRACPTNECRLKGSITAGTPVTQLSVSDNGDFIEVLDDKQRTGWVSAEFVVQEPSIKSLVPELEKNEEQLQQALRAKDDELLALMSELEEVRSKEAIFNAQIEELTEKNAQAAGQLNSQQMESQKDWFIKGGGVALGGVLLGLLISYLPKRRKRTDQWM